MQGFRVYGVFNICVFPKDGYGWMDKWILPRGLVRFSQGVYIVGFTTVLAQIPFF